VYKTQPSSPATSNALRFARAFLAPLFGVVLALGGVAHAEVLAPVHSLTIGAVDVSPGRGVDLTVHAMDQAGRSVADLRKVDVQFLQDGEPIEVSDWQMLDNTGTAVLIAIDRSRTMTGRPLEYARHAAHALVESLDSRDRVGLLLIDNDQELVVSFEDSRAHLLAQLQMLEAEPTATNTKIWDAVAHGVYLLRGEPRPGTVVLFTDGRDQGSEATPASLAASAAAGPKGGLIPIHPVAYRGRGDAGLASLTKLAKSSGVPVQRLDRETELAAASIAPSRNAYQARLDVDLDGATHAVRVETEGASAESEIRFPLVVEVSDVAVQAKFPVGGIMILATLLLGIFAVARRVRLLLRLKAPGAPSPNRWARSYGTGS